MPEQPIKGMAHITGGGLIDNIPRVLPEGCAVELYTDRWKVPPLFELIQTAGRIEPLEMARVFNMGLGMVLFVAPEHEALVTAAIPEAISVGRVVEQKGNDRVILRTEEGESGKWGIGDGDSSLTKHSIPRPPTPGSHEVGCARFRQRALTCKP